jgi:Zn-dependent M28 family amino/carboxypeptidase
LKSSLRRFPVSDPKLKEEEIAFSCHLDHQRPGANDNASGCVTILEVARTLQKLIAEGKAGTAGADHAIHLATGD